MSDNSTANKNYYRRIAQLIRHGGGVRAGLVRHVSGGVIGGLGAHPDCNKLAGRPASFSKI
jgi:hypothetical protein